LHSVLYILSSLLSSLSFLLISPASFLFIIFIIGSKPHEGQTAAPVGKALPSFIPPQRSNFTGSLNSGASHANRDFTKVGDVKREGIISQKSASAEKRPRKARPAKKKGDDGPGPGAASSSASFSSSGTWPEGGAEGVIADAGSVGNPATSAEGDAKVKVKRKYVRPAKQKVETAGATADNGVRGDGAEATAAGAEGTGATAEVKVESKIGEKEVGGEEGEEDATIGGVKRKREGTTGRGSRGGKARGMGRGQKASSSPNTAKRLKSGSPFPDGAAPVEGQAVVKEEVRLDRTAACTNSSFPSVPLKGQAQCGTHVA
jgi:hypothetical protein